MTTVSRWGPRRRAGAGGAVVGRGDRSVRAAEAVIVWVVAAKLAVKVWVPVVTSTEQVVLVVVTHVPPHSSPLNV